MVADGFLLVAGNMYSEVKGLIHTERRRKAVMFFGFQLFNRSSLTRTNIEKKSPLPMLNER